MILIVLRLPLAPKFIEQCGRFWGVRALAHGVEAVNAGRNPHAGVCRA